MKKQILRLLPLLLFLSPFDAVARDLRTPYGLDRGPFHYPIPCRPTDDEQCWNVDIWGAGLHRQASTAFIDKNSFKTDSSLAGIIFGKDTFVALDAFTPGTVSTQNPFLAFAQISPRVRYNENTVYFGTYIERQLPWGCDCAWRGGMRVTLPYRVINVGLDCCDVQEETLSDVCRRQNDRIDGSGLTPVANPTIQTVEDCYAYRLDFLSALFIQQAGVPPFDPLVEYSKFFMMPSPGRNTLAIDSADIGNINDNPVHMIRRTSGAAPQGPFCAPQNVVDALPFLSADGTGGADNERVRTNSNTNYAALGANQAAQRELWVVPTVGSAAGTIEQVTIADAIGTRIEQLTRNLPNAGALSFLEENGVILAPQHIEGLGQMVFEFYANRDWCDWFFEGIVGFNAPTGNEVKDPGQVYKIFNTGNNRHWGVKLGGIATYDPCIWFHLRGSSFYIYNLPKTERVAAPFTGATVKNIGPAIDAKISWHQWIGRLDTVWLVPCNPRVGMLLGYEGYFKSKDNVTLKQTSAMDFLGNTQSLDASVLERRTTVYSHKVRTEMFHQGDFWELFAGWTHVFAGRNAPKETDWHIGLIAFF